MLAHFTVEIALVVGALMPVRTLLVCSTHEVQEVTQLRAEVLKSAGIEVTTATESRECLRLISEPGWDALLVGYSRNDGSKIVEAFRATHPSGKIVIMLETPQSEPCAQGDVCVCGTDGPEALIHAIKS